MIFFLSFFFFFKPSEVSDLLSCVKKESRTGQGEQTCICGVVVSPLPATYSASRPESKPCFGEMPSSPSTPDLVPG